MATGLAPSEEASEAARSAVLRLAIDSKFVDLSQTAMLAIPREVFRFYAVEALYLEGNLLSALPPDMFGQLPTLTYLDLRNNRLEHLPETVGRHKRLKTLLLSGNQLAALPVELGLCTTLSAIALENNPLYFPPESVVACGVLHILEFLQSRCPVGAGDPAFVTQIPDDELVDEDVEVAGTSAEDEQPEEQQEQEEEAAAPDEDEGEDEGEDEDEAAAMAQLAAVRERLQQTQQDLKELAPVP